MYAEVIVFEDNGKPMMNHPYCIPATDIRMSKTEMENGGGYDILHYEFKFTMTKAVPRDPKMIDIIEAEHAAYERGYEEGREEVERYYAGGRY